MSRSCHTKFLPAFAAIAVACFRFVQGSSCFQEAMGLFQDMSLYNFAPLEHAASDEEEFGEEEHFLLYYPGKTETKDGPVVYAKNSNENLFQRQQFSLSFWVSFSDNEDSNSDDELPIMSTLTEDFTGIGLSCSSSKHWALSVGTADVLATFENGDCGTSKIQKHLTLVHNADNEFRLYENGAEMIVDGTVFPGAAGSGGDLVVGGGRTMSATSAGAFIEKFPGTIGGVVGFERVLSPQEISQLYSLSSCSDPTMLEAELAQTVEVEKQPAAATTTRAEQPIITGLNDDESYKQQTSYSSSTTQNGDINQPEIASVDGQVTSSSRKEEILHAKAPHMSPTASNSIETSAYWWSSLVGKVAGYAFVGLVVAGTLWQVAKKVHRRHCFYTCFQQQQSYPRGPADFVC